VVGADTDEIIITCNDRNLYAQRIDPRRNGKNGMVVDMNAVGDRLDIPGDNNR